LACQGDAPALAHLAEVTFRDTFGLANRDADMDAHCRESYRPDRQAEEIARPDGLTLLCEHEAGLIGFAQLRWQKPPPCMPPSAAEIQRLYVVKAWHGKGIAQTLMHAGLDAIRQRGFQYAWLGVWEHNARASAFYRKFGFVAVSEHVFQLGEDPQRDVLMVCPLR